MLNTVSEEKKIVKFVFRTYIRLRNDNIVSKHNNIFNTILPEMQIELKFDKTKKNLLL